MSDYWLYGVIIISAIYILYITGFLFYVKYKIFYEYNYLVNIGDIITIRHPDKNEEVKVKVSGKFYIGRNIYFGKVIDSNEEVVFVNQHICNL